MQRIRRITLEIIEEDGELTFNIDDFVTGENNKIFKRQKSCKTLYEAVGTFLKMLFIHKSCSIYVFFKHSSYLGDAGIEIKTGVYREYVYFIYNPTNRLTKIGKTNNVNRRLSTIQREVARECYLIHKIRCIQISAYELEAKAHKLFRLEGKHVKGEWFELNEDDHEWVKSCKDGYEFDYLIFRDLFN